MKKFSFLFLVFAIFAAGIGVTRAQVTVILNNGNSANIINDFYSALVEISKNETIKVPPFCVVFYTVSSEHDCSLKYLQKSFGDSSHETSLQKCDGSLMIAGEKYPPPSYTFSTGQTLHYDVDSTEKLCYHAKLDSIKLPNGITSTSFDQSGEFKKYADTVYLTINASSDNDATNPTFSISTIE